MVQTKETTNNHIKQEDLRLWVRIARLYYEHGHTQGEIAKQLGLSRIKIHRSLRAAREAGVVRIEIDASGLSFDDLELSLLQKYALRDVLIVPEQSNQDALYLALAQGGAEWLQTHLEDGIKVGLGLGRTVSNLPNVFQVSRTFDCTFTEIVGGSSEHPGSFTKYNVTSNMAKISGGSAALFYAPTCVSTPELKQALLHEPSVMSALERARNCDIIIQSIGPVSSSALLYLHGHITEDDLQALRDAGAVGDAVGRYFDCEGQPVEFFTDDLMVGINLEDLKGIPLSVLIAGGVEKTLPIDAALKGDFFNVLITDGATAKQLIKDD